MFSQCFLASIENGFGGIVQRKVGKLEGRRLDITVSYIIVVWKYDCQNQIMGMGMERMGRIEKYLRN